jgi:glycosyltransferase involved in cell wall biosynthesis
MNNQLLFITKKFPFDAGEEFLENEIFYLAAGFDSVIILAVAADASAQQTRDIPSNVRAVAAGIPPESKLSSLISPKGAVEASLKALMDDHDRRMQRFHPERWLYFRHFVRKVQAIRDAIGALFADGTLDASSLSLIYSFWFHDTAVAALLAREALSLDVPVVARAAGYDLYESSSPVGYHPLRLWALEHIDRVFPVSEEGRAYLDQRFPGFSSKIQAAYMATNDRGLGFYAASRSVQPFERSSFVMVSCSNFVAIKRLDLLVEALALLEEKLSRSLKWIHFGSGEQMEKIRELICKKLKKVDWTLAGQTPNSQLMEFYRDHPVDVFISVSESEGGPVTAMEALSFGIPVVVTNVGSVGESMADGKAGLSLPLDTTPTEVAESLFALARRSPDDYQDLRREARLLWERRFDTRKNYATFVVELLVLAAQRRR